MSSETQILDALNSTQGPICDDCITAVVGWNNRQQAHSVGSMMAERDTIIRAHGVCSRCGRRKIVNGLPLGAVEQVGLQPADMPVDKKTRIADLLRDGQLGREAIAAEVGVSPGVVSAVKAHVPMGAYSGSDTRADELAETSEVTFGLERDLQSALRSNIEQLEAGLKVTDGGAERITDAGRIDITAADAEGATVIIELKAGTAAPAALTQLLAYMGAVAEQDETDVRGLLVAGEFHPLIVSAAKAIPNVHLRRYRYNFMFEAVE